MWWRREVACDRIDMNEFIKQLVGYYLGLGGGPIITRTLRTVKERNLDLGSIELIGWLRDRGNGTLTGPLCVDTPLGRYLMPLLTEIPEMTSLFFIRDGNLLDFRSSVSANEQREIESYVVEHPQPEDDVMD